MKRTLVSKVMLLCISVLLFLSGCAVKYVPIDLFSEGLLAVEKNGSWGYVNTKGDKVIDYYFEAAYAFVGKYAIVERNGKYNLIDKSGVTQFEDDYDYLYLDIETGLLWFVVDELIGLMKTNGDIIVDPTYEVTADDDSSYSLEYFTFFQNGLARVVKDGLYGYINERGVVVIDTQYTSAGHFASNRAYFLDANNLYGYIDQRGTIKVDAQFDYAEEFNASGVAIVGNENDALEMIYAIIDESGDEIAGGFTDIETLGNIFIVEKTDEWYLINGKGKRLTEGHFDDYAIVDNFVMLATLDENDDATAISIFDITGDVYHVMTNEEVVSEELDDILTYKGDLYMLFVPNSGTTITLRIKDKDITFEASSIYQVYDTLVVAIRNGEYGVRTMRDKLVVDYLYQVLVFFDDDYILGRLDGLYGVLNSNGKVVVDFRYNSCTIDINPEDY